MIKHLCLSLFVISFLASQSYPDGSENSVGYYMPVDCDNYWHNVTLAYDFQIVTNINGVEYASQATVNFSDIANEIIGFHQSFFEELDTFFCQCENLQWKVQYFPGDTSYASTDVFMFIPQIEIMRPGKYVISAQYYGYDCDSVDTLFYNFAPKKTFVLYVVDNSPAATTTPFENAMPTSTPIPFSTPVCGPNTNDIDCDGKLNWEDTNTDGDDQTNETDTNDDNDEYSDNNDTSPGGPGTVSASWPFIWGGICPNCNTPTSTATFTPTFTPTPIPTFGGPTIPSIRFSFGVDNGHSWSSPPPGSLSRRMQKAKEDNVKFIRYFLDDFMPNQSVSALDRFRVFLDEAQNKGFKVLPVFDPYEYFKSNYSAYLFTQDVMFIMSNIMNDPRLRSNVLGIYLGNEPDEIKSFPGDIFRPKWAPNLNDHSPASVRVAADNFVNYYYPAAKAIRTHANQLLRELPIFAYGMYDPKQLYKDPIAGEEFWGQDGKTFLLEFIKKVLEMDSGITRAFLPNVITIHGYSNRRQPEEIIDDENRPWTERIDSLLATIHTFDGNYTPYLAVTEFGYSPRNISSWSVLTDSYGPNQRTQFIYFLRRFLMDSCMLSSDGQRNWAYDAYWQYPNNDDTSPTPNTTTFTGMFRTSEFEERTIRKVFHEIMSTNANRPGFGGNYKILSRTEKHTLSDERSFMKCMWTDPNGIKWGAIWRFTPVADGSEEYFTDFWYDEDYTFSFNQTSNPGNATLFKFSNSGTFDIVGTVSSIDAPGNQWNYSLEYIVDENPLFLKFSNNWRVPSSLGENPMG